MSKEFFLRRSVILFLAFLAIISLCSIVVSPGQKFPKGKDLAEKRIPVIVMLREKAREPGVKSLTSRRRAIAKVQNNVLSKLDEREFKLRHKYTIINGFSGEVTEEGLEKLRKDPNVLGIYEDKKVHAFLSESVPLINATGVWGLQINGENITGKGETICIIDTGIDYTHPDLGSCNLVLNNYSGNVEDYSLESPHPYPNNYENVWRINKTGFTKIAVHFVNISTEPYYDYVKIYDSTHRIIATYSGFHQDLWTPSSQGDTIYVSLISDEYFTDYGFIIDKVINGTVNTTYSWQNCTKVIDGYDIRNSDQNPMDDHGHGTHCAGIAAANGSLRGVAPDANLIAIKVLNESGYGTFGDIIAGIDWCVNESVNDPFMNISVISMSLGTDAYYSSYCDSNFTYLASAINTAVANNISVVVASGNNGSTSGISAPACIENATPVGASTKSDAIASFTNRGSGFPEMLLAPGVNINSTVPGGYVAWDGTSMATPHVAGAIALIKQYLRLTNQGRTPGEIEELLNKTGKRIYDSGTGLNFSRIDVYSAIMELNAPPVIVLNKPENASLTDKNYSILNWTCKDPEGKNMTAFVYGDNESANTLLNSTNCSSNASCTYNWSGPNETIYYWK